MKRFSIFLLSLLICHVSSRGLHSGFEDVEEVEFEENRASFVNNNFGSGITINNNMGKRDTFTNNNFGFGTHVNNNNGFSSQSFNSDSFENGNGNGMTFNNNNFMGSFDDGNNVIINNNGPSGSSSTMFINNNGNGNSVQPIYLKNKNSKILVGYNIIQRNKIVNTVMNPIYSSIFEKHEDSSRVGLNSFKAGKNSIFINNNN